MSLPDLAFSRSAIGTMATSATLSSSSSSSSSLLSSSSPLSTWKLRLSTRLPMWWNSSSVYLSASPKTSV